jgi:hypothetical protein
MTSAERESINKILAVANELKSSVQNFKDKISNEVDIISRKVESKHIPIHLESDILRAAQIGIGDAIKTSLIGYNSPLIKLTDKVIQDHSDELKQIITESFESVIRTEEFKKSIVNAFSHKVARTIISNNDGLFDKVSNELKQDSTFKSKMTLAVANVVEECLKEKKSKNFTE